MSAEMLREAARQMRDDFNGFDCRDCGIQGATMLALADWLQATAVRIDAGRDPRQGGKRNHGWRGSNEALAVARTYLGRAQ